MTVALSSSKTETVYWSLKIMTVNSGSNNRISKYIVNFKKICSTHDTPNLILTKFSFLSRGYSTKFYTERLRPEVQTLTSLNTNSDGTGAPFVYLLLTNGIPFTYLVWNYASPLTAVNAVS